MKMMVMMICCIRRGFVCCDVLMAAKATGQKNVRVRDVLRRKPGKVIPPVENVVLDSFCKFHSTEGATLLV